MKGCCCVLAYVQKSFIVLVCNQTNFQTDQRYRKLPVHNYMHIKGDF